MVAYDDSNGHHLLKYDDGDEHWDDMRLLQHHVLARPSSSESKTKADSDAEAADTGGATEGGGAPHSLSYEESMSKAIIAAQEANEAEGIVPGQGGERKTPYLDEDALKSMLKSQFDEALAKMPLQKLVQASPQTRHAAEKPWDGAQANAEARGQSRDDQSRPSTQERKNAFGSNLLQKAIAVRFSDGQVSTRSGRSRNVDYDYSCVQVVLDMSLTIPVSFAVLVCFKSNYRSIMKGGFTIMTKRPGTTSCITWTAITNGTTCRQRPCTCWRNPFETVRRQM